MYAEPHPSGDGTLIHLKVVPGASRSEVAGVTGNRLRVRVSAPPERGKANDALLKLLARRLGVRRADLALARGASNPAKTVHVRGLRPRDVTLRLED